MLSREERVCVYVLKRLVCGTQGRWLPELQEMVAIINTHFSRYLRAMGCNGQARFLLPAYFSCHFMPYAHVITVGFSPSHVVLLHASCACDKTGIQCLGALVE